MSHQVLITDCCSVRPHRYGGCCLLPQQIQERDLHRERGAIPEGVWTRSGKGTEKGNLPQHNVVGGRGSHCSVHMNLSHAEVSHSSSEQ